MMKNLERTFIHDINSPLSAALFILESLQDDLAQNPEQAETCSQVKAALDCLEKIKNLAQARRALLIQQDPEPQKT